MGRLQLRKTLEAVFVCCAAAGVTAAQTYTTLHNFTGPDGANPYAPLIQGFDGNLYGTTEYGGANNYGTVFKITPKGEFTTIHSFGLANDGAFPEGGLALDVKGNLYGTTYRGGNNDYGYGTIFEISRDGSFTTLATFDGTVDDGGENPTGSLVVASGKLYGVTANGGTYGYGTFYELTLTGAPTEPVDGTIYPTTEAGSLEALFSCTETKGGTPAGGLVVDTVSDIVTLLGPLQTGGPNNDGAVVRINPNKDRVLDSWDLDDADGSAPRGSLVQGNNGYVYSTASAKGLNDGGTLWGITPSGSFTVLYNFCSLYDCYDGGDPWSGVVLASDGNLYGTALFGGEYNYGNIYQFNLTTNQLTNVYSFSETVGYEAYAPPVQATDGIFYGATFYGGPNNDGAIYSLKLSPVRPFVDAFPPFGGVGATVDIVGNNLKGTTAVTFNGIAATFTVVTNVLIQAVIPEGATTGNVEVTTPHGKVSSARDFVVLE